MDIKSVLQEIELMEKKQAAYSHASAMIYYDSQTVAPSGSAPGRADTYAVLSEEEYKLFANERVGEALGYLSENFKELSFADAKKVERLKEEYDKMVKVPMDEYIEYTVLINESEDAWHKAKENNDYASFGPYIDKIVALKKKFAGYYDDKKHPYDVWLNEYERGSDMAFFDAYFAEVKAKLVPLIAEISKCPAPDTSFTVGEFPVYKQRKFSKDLMDFLGIDETRCVLGETEHPFTMGLNRYDCRITTHYYEDAILPSMYSVIHEGGHALYDMGINPEYYGTVLGDGTSMGIHESQSRFYENIVGRSRAFAGYILPIMRRYFPSFENVSADAFYRAINKSEPSLIRIEADELTYSLHIMIRYEIERMLFEGDVTAKDLPALWNKLYKEYLGVDVPNDSEGVLQDTHWGGGMFGYFPSYSIGSAYGAQMLFHMKKDLDVDLLVDKGDIKPIYDWLHERIYQYGASKTPKEIIEISCGEPFKASYYTDYLETKFRDVYGIHRQIKGSDHGVQ